jgi:hypothetical protein
MIVWRGYTTRAVNFLIIQARRDYDIQQFIAAARTASGDPTLQVPWIEVWNGHGYDITAPE